MSDTQLGPDVYRSLQRSDLTTDDVKRFGLGPIRTAGGAAVTYACPDCPLGDPAPFCRTCGGHGNIDESRLFLWQAQQASAVNACLQP